MKHSLANLGNDDLKVYYKNAHRIVVVLVGGAHVQKTSLSKGHEIIATWLPKIKGKITQNLRPPLLGNISYTNFSNHLCASQSSPYSQSSTSAPVSGYLGDGMHVCNGTTKAKQKRSTENAEPHVGCTNKPKKNRHSERNDAYMKFY